MKIFLITGASRGKKTTITHTHTYGGVSQLKLLVRTYNRGKLIYANYATYIYI